MTVEQAADLAFDMVRETKMKMILAGLCRPEDVYAACTQLATRLRLPLEMIVDAFEVA